MVAGQVDLPELAFMIVTLGLLWPIVPLGFIVSNPSQFRGAVVRHSWLLDGHDRRILSWVQKCSPYDLGSKSLARASREKARPFCTAQIDKYLPGKLPW